MLAPYIASAILVYIMNLISKNWYDFGRKTVFSHLFFFKDDPEYDTMMLLNVFHSEFTIILILVK